MTELVPEELPTDPKELQRLVQDLSRKQAKEVRFSASPEYRTLLLEAFESFSAPGKRFEPGQIVRWKPGLSNRALPDVTSVGVVIEHREDPYYAERDSASAYFQEPLDLALGIIFGEERSFVVYWFDSRRFELASE